MRDVRARNTKRYKEIAAELRDEIEASVAERPAFRAITAMRSTPIDRRWVVDYMGDEAAEAMPRGVPPLLRNGGVHPDTIAEQAGFATGREMIESLIELELAHRTAREEGDQRGMRDRIIDEELDMMMRERYGERPGWDVWGNQVGKFTGDFLERAPAAGVGVAACRRPRRPTSSAPRRAAIMCAASLANAAPTSSASPTAGKCPAPDRGAAASAGAYRHSRPSAGLPKRPGRPGEDG